MACFRNSKASQLISWSRFLYVRSFMRTIAERSVWCLLTIAEPVLLSFGNDKTYGFKLNFKEDVLVCAVAKRLILAVTTQAPRVVLAGYEVHSKRFFIVYHSCPRLLICTVYFLQRIRRYLRFIGFRGETRNLKRTNIVYINMESINLMRIKCDNRIFHWIRLERS